MWSQAVPGSGCVGTAGLLFALRRNNRLMLQLPKCLWWCWGVLVLNCSLLWTFVGLYHPALSPCRATGCFWGGEKCSREHPPTPPPPFLAMSFCLLFTKAGQTAACPKERFAALLLPAGHGAHRQHGQENRSGLTSSHLFFIMLCYSNINNKVCGHCRGQRARC